MSKITIHNYEAYLLDSMEGNLSAEMAAELVLFFENNPDLKEDIEGFEILELKPKKTELINKETLKKELITSKNYEELIIAEIENENTAEESVELAAFISKNKKHQKEFELYQKTKLVAPTVVFENKEQLKRKERKIIPLYWWLSSAAAVLLALFLLKGVFNTTPPVINKVVEIIEKKEPKAPQEEKQPEKVLAFKTTREQPVEKKQKRKKSLKKEVIKTLPVNVEEPKVFVAEERDSVFIPKTIEEEPIFYANNVKITYEDDPVEESDKPLVSPQKKKKKGLFKKIFNSQVRDKFRDKVMRKEVNENGEIVAYALAVGRVNLYRKEVK